MFMLNKKMKSKRKIILNNSLKLFSEKGYEQTTIHDISTRSELAKGLIYHYFSSKESILDTIIYQGIPLNMEKLGIFGKDKIYPIEQVFYRIINVCSYYRAYWKITMLY
jgi:AcrR family transcriptional regulator